MLALGALTTLIGCFHPPPPPPTVGYGEPYKGTGEGIYIKDSRTDWDVTEGHHKITSEKALEAAEDPEYEARRQIAKTHNAGLRVEAVAHQKTAYRVLGASAAAIVLGYIASFVVAPRLQSEALTSPGLGMPETRTYTSGFATDVVATTGIGLLVAGVAGLPYAYLGGRRPPPYYAWRTPKPLFRPAYVRQQTEPYNEKIGAPSMPDADTGTQPAANAKLRSPADTQPSASAKLRPPPGVRPAPGPRHIPRPRGAR